MLTDQREITKKAQEAIEAALNKKWEAAVELNKEILDFDSENMQALNRISKAYLELDMFEEAKKQLKKVLKLDPINQTAKRNLELAEAGKSISNSPLPDVKSLIKEPGISKEFTFNILAKDITAKDFYMGEKLKIDFHENKVALLKSTGELIGIFDAVHSAKMNGVKKMDGTLNTFFIGGEGKDISILVKSTIPVFKSEKQDIKPYIKRETLEEQEEGEHEHEEAELEESAQLN